MKQGNAVVLSYVPSILPELVSGGRDSPPWGDVIEGTLVMADVSGFTTMSERLAQSGPEGAEQLTGIINRFFGRHLDSARDRGGDCLAFGGDAILLLFRHDGHADRAVAAACEILSDTRRMPSIELPGGRVKLGMSIGAHSGAFLLAAAGLLDERMQLFVLGSNAVGAAAAEARAERGELIVSPATAARLAGSWRLEDAEGWLRVSAGRVKSHDPVPPPQAPPLRNDVLRRLLPFAPPRVREAVRAGRSPGHMPPEHRRVSVVFVGVRGLNDIIEREGAQAALGELQEYMAGVTALATKHHGFLVSTDIDPRGFKLVLTFGAPVAHEFAAANAARFVLELQRQADSGARRLAQCVGVNGGPVFAGEVGPSWRRQYTVMGDEVNLSARLMGSAEPGVILATRSCAQQAGSRFYAEERSPIRVKGKAQPVAVCTLKAERALDAPTSRWRTPLLGRERELELLRQSWAEVGEGSGRMLVVEGEPGVGKSRLLDEAVARAVRDGRVLRTSCLEHLQGIPFAPWVGVLTCLLGLVGGKDVTARTAAAIAAVGRWAPDLSELASLLNPLLGLGIPASEVVASLDVQSRRERLIDLVTRLLTASCPPRGQVLLVEDVHWADGSSMALLAHLAEHIHGSRLLLLASTRTSDLPVRLPASVTRLVLGELSREDSLKLMRSSLAAPDLPEAVADAVHAKTRGNPLFLEEVIHSLGAPGALAKIRGASSVAQAAELATLAIPDRVQGLLMSRLDSLPAREHEVLKVAAVVGRQFHQATLSGLPSLPVKTRALGHVLHDLDQAALIVPAGESGSFTFRHALLQEVAYDSLPYARRRAIHGEVASFLEASSGRPDHGLLVHHYRQAGNRERLRVHAARAAESSQAVYAFREAVDYLGIALETVRAPTPAQASLRSRLEELTGDCLESLARHDEAVDSYLHARRRWASPAVRAAATVALAEVAPVSDLESRASDLCRKVGMCLERQHRDYRRALRWLEKAEVVLPPGRTALASRLQVTRGVIHFRLGRFEEALAYGERGLALARQDGDDLLQAYALGMLVNPLVGLGLLHRSLDIGLEAVALYERAGDLAGQASGHGNLAACYQLVGDLRASLLHHETSLELNRRLSYDTGVSIIHNNIAEVLLQLGRTEEAIEHLEQVVDDWEERKMPPALVGFAFVNLSKAFLRRREFTEAGRALGLGRPLLAQAHARGLLIEADLQGAKLLLSDGRLGEARSACEEVIAVSRETGAKVGEAHALSLLGRVELSCRHLAAAEGWLLRSIELAKEAGADYERGLALLTLSELLCAWFPWRIEPPCRTAGRSGSALRKDGGQARPEPSHRAAAPLLGHAAVQISAYWL